jgi:hypothetical protein
VSQALMDYVTAHHMVLTNVLDMLAAEYRLSDENSSVVALRNAEGVVDLAAEELALAVEALPPDSNRKPVGWDQPPALSGVLGVARRRVVKACLRCLSAQHADESADADAESEYADEQLALACRNLAADIDATRRSPTRTWERTP